MQHSFDGLDRPGGLARVGLLRPLASRDFRLLWAGMSVSLVGDGAFLVASAWTAYSLWDTPAALSVVGVALTVPTIACLLVGGAVSDRYDRRRVMFWSDALRAVAVAAAAALAFAGALTFPALVAVAAVYAVGAGFFTPAFESIVPALVPPEHLPQANALDQFVRPIALRLVGPVLGGWLIALLGTGTAFAVDAASFAVSAATVLALRRPGLRAEDGASESTLGAVREGLRFVRSRTWLWGTLASAAVAYLLFLGPTEVLLPYVVKNTLGGSATDLGLVLAAGGLGAIGAAALMAQRGEPRRPVTAMYACWTLATLAVVGYGVGRSIPQLAVACLLFNGLEAAGTVIWATIKQRHVPQHLLGRVSSLDWLISISLLPVSYALTGPAAAAFGVGPTLVAAGVAGGAVTLAALYLPAMREIEEPEGSPRRRLLQTVK
jgi:DHA3 family tetracycline resistance protein-like MFS transporter